MRVLVAEDDQHLRASITRGLRDRDIESASAGTFAEARESALFAMHDVIILDVMLPGGSGFDLCALLRSRGLSTPVLMLTARDAVADRVRGLEAGADDHLTKPFAFEELVARIRALARRAHALIPEVLRVADLDVDLSSRRVSRGGKPIVLTAKEFALLECFVRHENSVLDRASIAGAPRTGDPSSYPKASIAKPSVIRS